MKIQIQNCKVMTDKPCVGFLTEGARSDPDVHFVERRASRRQAKFTVLEQNALVCLLLLIKNKLDTAHIYTTQPFP